MKKFLSGFLVLCLSLALLTACGTGGQTGKTVTAGGFSVGDTVSHPTLGQGKIVAIHYPEKPAETNLEIAFNGSEKTKSLKLMFVQEKLKKIG